MTYSCFAQSPRYVEELLADELTSLGAADTRITPGGVSFSAPLETVYRICLWSRLANRILFPLSSFPASTPEELYAGARSIRWFDHLDVNNTFAVDANVSTSALTHSGFAALKVKDAVADVFRERYEKRPSVDTHRPSLRIYLHLYRNEATVGIDLSGDSLHRRGYRVATGAAPLKENVAAAILIRAGWPETAAAGGAFVDPMCGTGTLPIEATLIAGDIAPGLFREYWGFSGWLSHNAPIFRKLIREAEERRSTGLRKTPPIFGFDIEWQAIAAAQRNADAAGLSENITFAASDFRRLTPPPGIREGLLATNPPYGERLGEREELSRLYGELGSLLKKRFSGWKASVLTGSDELAKSTGLRASKVNALFNGPIRCTLAHFTIGGESDRSEPAGGSHGEAASERSGRPETPAGEQPRKVVVRVKTDSGAPSGGTAVPSAGEQPEAAGTPEELPPGAEMLKNRLNKDRKHLGKWARKNGVRCYRLYDADLPEYNAAVDIYEEKWAHLQEYAAPGEIPEEKAQARLETLRDLLPGQLGIDPGNIFVKQRKRQKGSDQYEKFAETGEYHEISEGGLRFLANFTDYLDTGIFLDHRVTRSMLRDLAEGRRFLNLFAYTCTASVYAAAGGALSTVSVDNSNTYLEWGERNMQLNGFSGARHRFIREDCLRWLKEEKSQYDLIFLDPPTFSNSRRMAGTLDIQRDHPELIRQAAKLLSAEGILIFSNNFRKFKMDSGALPGLAIQDITPQTIPQDFLRNPKIHNCWLIRKK